MIEIIQRARIPAQMASGIPKGLVVRIARAEER
jgi:hypothetical protein